MHSVFTFFKVYINFTIKKICFNTNW